LTGLQNRTSDGHSNAAEDRLPMQRQEVYPMLLSYMKYYNGARRHLSLEKDAPFSRAVGRAGQILCLPILGGLHHQYVRI
jgi:hypothetical protein